MKKSRYSETQIVKILKEVEVGRKVNEVCREYGISDATYYNWKAKYGGMEASEGLCCVIQFRDRAAPFRVFLSQYDKFQAYLIQ
jgi:hypothetical protein